MKNKKRLFIILGLAVILLAILAVVVIRYVPWHKLMKVPTSNEGAFIQQDPLRNVAPNALSFDFEVDSTQDVPHGIYKGIAHSGNYSAEVFGKNSFSVSVVRTAGEIGLENLNAVAMSAWVYAFPTDNEVNGSLVFAANNSVGVNLCWKGVPFTGPMIPKEQWTKISGYFDLSDVRLRPDDKIQLYFWNNSSTDLLVDDFYYVFGAPRERLGDSGRIDMTKKEGYTPGVNYPPFPPLFLQKQQINNGDGVFLIHHDNVNAGEITPDDQVIAGNFITAPGALQSMLVIKSDGKPELYHYCEKYNSFQEIILDCPADLYPILQGFTWMKGSFLSSPGDQLFVAGPNGMILIGFEATAVPCSRNDVAARVKVLWRTDESQLAGVTLQHDRQLTSGDLFGDRAEELLLFDKDGSWKILQFSPAGLSGGEWIVAATGEEYKVREWNRGLVEFKAIAAPYLSACNHDIILTVFRDLKSGKNGYTLLRYQPADRKFVKVFPDRQGSVGLTIGIDTLKLADQLMPGHFQPGDPLSFFRYNRDWRYDLKEIRFNDSTFQILASVDFTGYDEDQNPKYYEILKLCTGNWIDQAVTSVLVIGRNRPDSDLPNTLQVYSFTPNQR
ncbi:MAG: hypothetical protein ISS17_06035 [Bacteroidales bacterium]|nr:hypothetical protein [Bacteroidales bacterium]